MQQRHQQSKLPSSGHIAWALRVEWLLGNAWGWPTCETATRELSLGCMHCSSTPKCCANIQGRGACPMSGARAGEESVLHCNS